ncbi:MAG: xanthine dehydrogenase molybdopterin binding subunit [Alphaproteobacteria bacterium]
MSPDETRSRTRTARLKGAMGETHAHDSAALHVSGEAIYADDIALPKGALDCYILLSPHARASFVIDADSLEAARAMPGVSAVLTAQDVPGVNDVGPVFDGDPIFAPGEVHYAGQSVLAVAASSLKQARQAAHAIAIDWQVKPAVITIDQALEADYRISPPYQMTIGDAEAGLDGATHHLTGQMYIGGQDHFYLEGQVAVARPGEAGEMHVTSSTQHPSEVQHLVARALARADHEVVVEVRRMGGGFGGKETQPALIASIAALAAETTGQPVRLCLDRDDDMRLNGKRHDFKSWWEVGVTDDGRITGIIINMAARCGMSADLSNAVIDRASFHADNCYHLGNAKVITHRMRTDTVSNTAFRGFGGPQGMLTIEAIMDQIARDLKLDPIAVRQRNYYAKDGSTSTHYHQPVTDFIADELVEKLAADSDYQARRDAIDRFNQGSESIKRGLALSPVKFGISFTATHLNQAGALVHIYQDGSVLVNHGGTEMGQGLFTKVAQVVADRLGLAVERIKPTSTRTDKIANTSATAASSGSDLNGMAAKDACDKIRARLAAFVAADWGCDSADVRFEAEALIGPDGQGEPFVSVIKRAYMARVQLWDAGFYATPDIGWDRDKARGNPFYYFAYGAAVTEVAIDVTTGEYRLLRTDLLHDVGRSLNPAIDIGQIEGGYIQGVGWLTAEELVFDDQGTLRTHAPSTYKIPTIRDVPEQFNVALHDGENPAKTIYRSKAVGEPPFMLANSAWLALVDAVSAAADHAVTPRLNAPATPEEVLRGVTDVLARAAGD